MKKIKKDSRLIKENVSFSPTHIMFNFSFLSYMENFDKNHKAQLVNRIIELSKEPYLVLAQWPKEKGFENISIEINKKINPNFFESENRTFDGKYTIIRLYPNNNPLPSRIIGKMLNKIFYVFFIDIEVKLYKH